ncbi:MAG: hypothetical protein MJ093_06155 [Saccharofermentans sp.]|nr:hypothetical protein [Saccharofermentans sp.]
MGLFNRMIGDIARSVANNVANNVGNSVAEKYINPAVNNATESFKTKVVEKVAQAEEAIYTTPPTFSIDKENNNILAIASRDKLYFMDKVPGGEPKKVSLKFLSTLKFSVDGNGSFEGNTSAANRIHEVVLTSAQQVFDECASKHMTMAAAIENMKVLSVQVKEKAQGVFAEYGISNPQYLIAYVLPSGDKVSSVGETPVEVKPDSWQCQYCGSTNTSKFCSSCGSPRP